MRIDYVNISIFHRRDNIKIEEIENSGISYDLGKKEKDDNFRIEFKSINNEKFLILHESKNDHHEQIEEKEEKVSTKISLHRKLVLVTIRSGGIADKYQLEIKHEDHRSLLFVSKVKEIKIFLHTNGLPDSNEIDTHKNHFFMRLIFQIMDENEIPKITNT